MKKLHIVSFNNPYPPDYGGVMDVFFKIKALHEAGIAIILHVFQYNRPPAPELLQFCEKVYYYPRKIGWLSHISFLPYIVKSRVSDKLLTDLCHDDSPILFEGLHCCYYLNHPALRSKQKIVRMHNIEHQYYKMLSKSASNLRSKWFFLLESLKLKSFENILIFADVILAISSGDTVYFEEKYGNTRFVGAFHSNSSINGFAGRGKYIIMHGNLSVEENEHAILHCLRNILTHIDFPVVIAGKNPTSLLRREIAKHEKVILVENPTELEMDRLQHEAHIHLCYTFQSSGFKLKLLNSLYKGRFVVANSLMTEGSELDALTITCKSDNELINTINKLIPLTFDNEELERRISFLESFDTSKSTAKIISLLQSLA